jgi:hypothetical protein
MLALAISLLIGVAFVPTASAETCPTAPDPGALADAATLRQMNSHEASLRPTASPAHEQFVNWIRDQLRAIPGVQLSELNYRINRWNPSAAKLIMHVGGADVALPVADAIPYSQPTTPSGVTAPLAVVTPDQKITAANSAGKIVVREADAGSVPYYDFLLPVVGWETYDPNRTIDPNGTFYGDFINYIPRVNDLRDAAAAGARGLLYVKPLPRSQILDHYEPYEGEDFRVPGVFMGADEGKLITDAIAAGKHPTAQIIDNASFYKTQTASVEATISGQSAQRIVIDSHTDGVNAVEDNGPIAMIAMARYFAALPADCRPRTIQFSFTTAHFYQRVVDYAVRDGGAEQLAEQLDRDYDKGTVSSVVTIEHLGALDYEQVPRSDGGPGLQLKPNGLRAIQFIGVTPSPMLVAAVDAVVRTYDLQRTILLQGADAPGSTVPSHCSFGGEGTPYNEHLLPTVGIISAPQTLYDPVFQLEAIDFNVMHSELLAYTELVNRLQVMSQSDVAGSVPTERAQRAAGSPTCPTEIPPATYGPGQPAPAGSTTTTPSVPSLALGCRSRRRFILHVRVPTGFSVRSARLRTGSHTVTIPVRINRHRLAVVIDLRGLPKGTTRIRLTIRGPGNRMIRITKAYRLCARPRRLHHHRAQLPTAL